MQTLLSINSDLLADACDNALFKLQEEQKEKIKKVVENYMFQVSLETGIWWKTPGRVISYEEALVEIEKLDTHGISGESTAKNEIARINREYDDVLDRLELLYSASCMVSDQADRIKGVADDLLVCLEDYALVKDELEELLKNEEEEITEIPPGTN